MKVGGFSWGRPRGCLHPCWKLVYYGWFVEMQKVENLHCPLKSKICRHGMVLSEPSLCALWRPMTLMLRWKMIKKSCLPFFSSSWAASISLVATSLWTLRGATVVPARQRPVSWGVITLQRIITSRWIPASQRIISSGWVPAPWGIFSLTRIWTPRRITTSRRFSAPVITLLEIATLVFRTSCSGFYPHPWTTDRARWTKIMLVRLISFKLSTSTAYFNVSKIAVIDRFNN